MPIATLYIALLAASDCTSLTPEAIANRIDEHGARSVVSEIWKSEAEWACILSHISSGQSNWLDLSVALRPGTDAAAGLSLRFAVSRAIPNNPGGVLKLTLSGPFSVADVCTSPFIEPDPGIAEDFEKSAIEALKTVTDTELSQARDECLEKIKLPVKAA